MAASPLPRWRVVVCTECGARLFRLRIPAEPESREVRRHAGVAFEQALSTHWQRCDGVVFVAVDELHPPGDQTKGDVRMSDDQDRHLDITPAALKVIQAMQERVAAIGTEYGQESSEHVEALRSVVAALVSVFRLGGRITKEDELSLFGASFIAYGVIFFPRKTHGVPDPLLGEWSVHS